MIGKLQSAFYKILEKPHPFPGVGFPKPAEGKIINGIHSWDYRQLGRNKCGFVVDVK